MGDKDGEINRGDIIGDETAVGIGGGVWLKGFKTNVEGKEIVGLFPTFWIGI